ncbi:UDP-N-acetylglucosamine 1-carboxyvinyltransferase [Lutibaculum baratangense]|uniref:UDP-N-acetylglucosamine 1-carboxyvinyltransferase n=1 Tax=Lutibaculum baratangense AMV1 TaxID=631454 RepID=V4RC20_9HYPH|nr:UDP-N-acetylglucosamine 1-carboxyvinyltransferase [Lutibaculum baratangense]ESR23711.1 UDP-N-acetylglucosamine 1-carboxyvinyltransferase [Lutibaculum baratangense AMV1]
MEKIRIRGGRKLEGTIPISGAKNAALPLMIASILTPERLTLENVPRLRDVSLLGRILNNHGVDMTIAGKRQQTAGEASQTLHLEAADICDTEAPYELVSQMRASFWVLGPLLARCGEARVSLPGGCAIGTRPVDFHLQGLKALGAQIDVEGGYVVAKAPKGGLVGGRVTFPKVSVGATHNVLMAAAMARGQTVIENAAREPEIADVAECLRKMGARISGAGTSTIEIEGVSDLHGATHEVLPDRIETGTYAMCVAMTGGDVVLENARADLLDEPIAVLREAGVDVSETNRGLRIQRNGQALQPISVETAPFPGFPTDLQAQLMAMMTRADGTSTIRETIFENRFMHVQELARFGADISLDGELATVKGVKRLTGAPVMATDLRASVSLVIAGLAAEGETTISRIYHLDRGFERLEEKLGACGAEVERLAG